MPKISVIIPVYKTEKYINKCLNSIVNQTIGIENIELIIVNDGSPDNSENVINEFIKDNKKADIKYLKKENGGLSDARNYGIEFASGDYIAFVDSDDYVTENLYKDLLPYMEENYDMIKYKIITVDEDDNVLSNNYSPNFKEKNRRRGI